MTRLWFVMPVHGREALTKVCLRQLRRTCDAMTEHGIEATAVVIGEGRSLAVANGLGFATVRRPNDQLGTKFNDGYQLACDPAFNPRPAHYCVPIGSDDWVDPRVFRTLPAKDAIGFFSLFAAVSEDRTRLGRMRVTYTGGVGIRVIPAPLLAKASYRPADEDRKRAIDTSTLHGLTTANGGMPRLVALDVHPLQIVDWKSSSTQLNSYGELQGHRRDESSDPFGDLSAVYPADAIAEMRAVQ